MPEYYPNKTQQLVEMLADLKDAVRITIKQQDRVLNTLVNLEYLLPDMLDGTEDYEAFIEAMQDD